MNVFSKNIIATLFLTIALPICKAETFVTTDSVPTADTYSPEVMAVALPYISDGVKTRATILDARLDATDTIAIDNLISDLEILRTLDNNLDTYYNKGIQVKRAVRAFKDAMMLGNKTFHKQSADLIVTEISTLLTDPASGLNSSQLDGLNQAMAYINGIEGAVYRLDDLVNACNDIIEQSRDIPGADAMIIDDIKAKRNTLQDYCTFISHYPIFNTLLDEYFSQATSHPLDINSAIAAEINRLLNEFETTEADTNEGQVTEGNEMPESQQTSAPLDQHATDNSDDMSAPEPDTIQDNNSL